MDYKEKYENGLSVDFSSWHERIRSVMRRRWRFIEVVIRRWRVFFRFLD